MSDENAETLDVISNEATKTNGGSFVFEEQKDGGPKEGSVCMDSKVKIHVVSIKCVNEGSNNLCFENYY